MQTITLSELIANPVAVESIVSGDLTGFESVTPVVTYLLGATSKLEWATPKNWRSLMRSLCANETLPLHTDAAAVFCKIIYESESCIDFLEEIAGNKALGKCALLSSVLGALIDDMEAGEYLLERLEANPSVTSDQLALAL